VDQTRQKGRPLTIHLAAKGHNPQMDQTKLSRRWCLFAIVMLALVLPFETRKLFGELTLYDAARYVIDTVAVIGVSGYAFSIRIGPQVMWRVFAPIFIIFSVIIAASGLPRLYATQLPSTGVWIALSLILCMGLAMIGFTALALLRYGGWLDATRPSSNAFT
jgi:hypothetical protein